MGRDSDSPQALPQAGQLCPKPTGHLANQARHSSEPGLTVGRQPGPRCQRLCVGRAADHSAGREPVSTALHSSSHPPTVYWATPQPHKPQASHQGCILAGGSKQPPVLKKNDCSLIHHLLWAGPEAVMCVQWSVCVHKDVSVCGRM